MQSHAGQQVALRFTKVGGTSAAELLLKTKVWQTPLCYEAPDMLMPNANSLVTPGIFILYTQTVCTLLDMKEVAVQQVSCPAELASYIHDTSVRPTFTCRACGVCTQHAQHSAMKHSFLKHTSTAKSSPVPKPYPELL